MSERFSALLDTHVLLWWLNGDPRINAEREQQLSLLPCLVSAVSVWEVAIKYRRGKLPVSPTTLLECVRSAGLRTLPIQPEHTAATAELPDHHNDLFDRLLIAQAQTEGLRLITADRILLRYGNPVELL
jgi:PIN domain nuclease of toxin-antitoxin system